MKRLFTIAAAFGLLCTAPVAVQAGPEQDLQEFRSYFAKRFPDTPFKDYVNGVYSIDQASREQWEAIEEFPPYELNVEKGKELFNTPFKNGKTYASCFDQGGEGIACRGQRDLQVGDRRQRGKILGLGLLQVEFGFLTTLVDAFGDLVAALLDRRVLPRDADPQLRGSVGVIQVGHLCAE